MPRIFDNIERELLECLDQSLRLSERADMCVGYFNLRGWRLLQNLIEPWPGGDEHCCRLLVGMQRLPQEDLKLLFSQAGPQTQIDQGKVIALKRAIVADFRKQLTVGAPTNEDERALQRLSAQLKADKVRVKLFLRYPLHAKLYLLHRADPQNPRIGIVGSSNLTMSGLRGNGELNVDVLDHDATEKLHVWFNARWNDQYCLDITRELIEVLDTSWARSEPILPYYIYLKIAYHLSIEAQAGLVEFKIPTDLESELFKFQSEAVRIAAGLIHRRGGCLIGDVVGIGKTRVASAVARILEDDLHLETLIICPVNLQSMWKEYAHKFRLRAEVLPISRVIKELPSLRRYRLVIIDESHNLRNPESKAYRAIQEYVQENESRLIMLSATPYNKTYLDLSSQLRLFINSERDLGVRPEALIRSMGGELEFRAAHPNTSPRTIGAFERSEYTDDWRELMRLFMIRRTRSFIEENYTCFDAERDRHYLELPDGRALYFPKRQPRTVPFTINEKDPNDQYARLYSPPVVDLINQLSLPRYGLGRYVNQAAPTSPQEDKAVQNLSRAGKRLIGFCRTNLFKRLESSGHSFICSLERHILRNMIFVHAIENDLPLPIGTQDVGLLDTRITDKDTDPQFGQSDDGENSGDVSDTPVHLRTEEEYRERAAAVYGDYQKRFQRRFKWLRASLFRPDLLQDLLTDARLLLNQLQEVGDWHPEHDAKLTALIDLVQKKHPTEKILIFTQFADTVDYLERNLAAQNVTAVEGVTGQSPNPTEAAWKFSPVSNEKKIKPAEALRVLIATDVLSEGQNLQDSHILVNYDLPWAIIRLIQRAGRVDRIGQTHDTILAYTFMPAEGVEQIINLRARLTQRLKENAEVVGTDEQFFEDHATAEALKDLFTEKNHALNDPKDDEVDLGSMALRIWKTATDKNPALATTIENLPDVVYSARAHTPTTEKPAGALVYVKTAEDNDALAWVDERGQPVTESQYEILKIAECAPDTPAVLRSESHHQIVQQAMALAAQVDTRNGGQLGAPSKPRARVYDRLKTYIARNRDTLFVNEDLIQAVDLIYRRPLKPTAFDTIGRQLKTGISDEELAELVRLLYLEERLCQMEEDSDEREPRVICSLGLVNTGEQL